MESEVISSTLNPFQVIPDDNTIEYIKQEYVYPLGPSGPNTRFLEFVINRDSNHWTRLDLQLVFQLSYYHRDGTPFREEHLEVGPINDPGVNIWSDMVMKVNSQKASPTDFSCFPISYLHHFCKSKAEKQSSLQASLYYEDSHDSYEAFNQSNPWAAPPDQVNHGLQKRTGPFGRSAKVQIVTSLPFLPLTGSMVPFPPETKFEIQLYVANATVWTMGKPWLASYYSILLQILLFRNV